MLLTFQIVEEDSFEDYIPEEDIVLEEEYLHPPTAEKETNTECNFCPEGARQLHRRYVGFNECEWVGYSFENFALSL